MDRNEILHKLNEIFIEVMNLDNDFQLKEEMSSDNIEEWDSLSHIQLVVAIEKSFGIKFAAKEILGWEEVKDCIDSIVNRLA